LHAATIVRESVHSLTLMAANPVLRPERVREKGKRPS
jgi:hypothetical protein